MTDIENVNSYCYRIKGLYVPYQTPESIEQDIEKYIGSIELYTERLDNSFKSKDVSGFTAALETIQAMLQAVFAKQCMSYVNSLIDAAKNRGIDHCGQLLRQAVADLLLLSIEMQKAQMVGTSRALKYKQVEKNEEIARSLSAIKRMIDLRDYERAQSLAFDMKGTDDAFITLFEMLKSRQYGKAKDLADAMEKEHIGLIQRKSTSKVMKTVLAVDDVPSILTNMNVALRSHYKVLAAPSGRIALEVMSQQKIDLFYLDIDMPEMDGLELAGHIRADHAYAKTPIIFLTGNASRENIARGTRLGISDFIVKPSNNINLLVKARMYMEG